jgi:hypothetical protein
LDFFLNAVNLIKEENAQVFSVDQEGPRENEKGIPLLPWRWMSSSSINSVEKRTSCGRRSGLPEIREKPPPVMVLVKAKSIRVLAVPGNPSKRMCPWAKIPAVINRKI